MARINDRRCIQPARPGRGSPKADPDEGLRKLFATGFRHRVDAYRAGDVGVTLQEVPHVLDQLRDLNVVELRRLVQVLGEDYRALRSTRMLPPGRLCAEGVLQILGGAPRGRGPILPTSAKTALQWVTTARMDRALLRRLGVSLDELERVALELGRVPKRRWADSFEVVFTPGFAAGIKRVGGGFFDMGVIAGREGRHHRRWHARPLATGGFHTALGGVAFQGDQHGAGVGATVHILPFTNAGVRPLEGRHINFIVPMIGGVFIGERYLGVVANPGSSLIKPCILLGIRGDPLLTVTGPLVDAADDLKAWFNQTRVGSNVSQRLRTAKRKAYTWAGKPMPEENPAYPLDSASGPANARKEH